MTKYKYTTTAGENAAKAVGVSLPISIKHSIEVCNYIRGKKVEQAKKDLQAVVDMKKPVPYTRFTGDLGHKRGMGPGRYPIKTCQVIKQLVESAEANAQFKGLSASSLIVKHIAAQKGLDQWHYGRQRRRKMKRCHIEIIVEEGQQEKTTEKKKVAAKKPVEKKEVKAEEKKAAEEEKKSVEKKEAAVEKKEVKAEEKKEETKVEKKEVKKATEKPAQEQTKKEEKQ